MSKIAPCLWFDGKAEEAARFWTSLFPASALGTIGKYGEGMPFPAGTVLIVEFTVGGRRFQALNGGPRYSMNPSISFFVHVDAPDEANRLFAALADGGRVLMPIDAYPFSPRYGWVQDRFGASWQVITSRRPSPSTTVVPCLMFAAGQAGRAHEAMERMCSLFPDSRLDRALRYEAGEGSAGDVKHGLFTLAGDYFVALDSRSPHAFSYSEGISLSVRCADQAEVDRLWDALCDGGQPGPCGWLKDCFGVSWQIVPDRLVELQNTEDHAARDRLFQAMMRMGKLDVAGLERAYRGD
jgi:predicted 3-demethylubiquinone-9 3-methyltransferase (glyoxalase superfamily)